MDDTTPQISPLTERTDLADACSRLFVDELSVELVAFVHDSRLTG